jgi:putative phage-type endonuclease
MPGDRRVAAYIHRAKILERGENVKRRRLMTQYRTISTKGMSRSDWLRLRQSGIGGSDAPALLLPSDVYKWRRPRDVYASKIGEVEEASPLACEVGTFLEPFVARLFERASGFSVHCKRVMLQSINNPCMLANIDRKITGQIAGLEIKTTSSYRDKQFTEESFPYEYYIQIQHYLAVTGWERWYLAALIGNHRFAWYEVKRNEVDIAGIIETEKKFWEQIILPRNTEELELWQ